jgi:hypothetical protein
MFQWARPSQGTIRAYRAAKRPMRRYLSGTIAGATLTAIPGAGHAANLTHPQPTNATIEDFLARIYWATRFWSGALTPGTRIAQPLLCASPCHGTQSSLEPMPG